MGDLSTPVFRIFPTTQQYDWGKVGLTSKVAQLVVASKQPNFTLDHSRPYAELWMGTHPSSPSSVASLGVPLSAHLAAHPHLVGAPIIEQFGASDGGGLPFLLKVLSIQKALSIQAHPDKCKAEQLHAANPHVYKDANHKPEMAIALTPFSALCGFLPREQISLYLSAVPEFAALIPDIVATHFNSSSSVGSSDSQSTLESLFSALMTAEPRSFKPQLHALISRYRDGGAFPVEQDVAPLVLELYSQFPDDIGVFCVYMLNHVKLHPGEAIFLGAGEPHAYISGDIIECMANSDNVIRAGLTPKLRDVPNLLACLSYTSGHPARHAIHAVPFEADHTSERPASTVLYDAPIPEFSVLRTIVKPGHVETHRAIWGPSIALVLAGRGGVRWPEAGNLDISPGHVLFVGRGTELQFEARAGVGSDSCQDEDRADEDLIVFRAFVEEGRP